MKVLQKATVSKWLKKEGETVEADEPIVELETDKVNLEVPSPISGTLAEINSKDGSVVEVGALLGSVSENGIKFKKRRKKLKKLNQLKKMKIMLVNLEPQKKEPEIFENEEKKMKKKEPLNFNK